MVIITDMATLQEPCPNCTLPWIQHPVDDRGDYYCRDLTESVIHAHADTGAICLILAYANWMRAMENPEEAVP